MEARHQIIKLSWKDKGAFVSVMENAFSMDPLFKKLFTHEQTSLTDTYRVNAFLSFMFEMSMLSGADVCGIFAGDRLVGCYLLEVPVKNPFRRIGGSILVLIRALALPYQISVKSFRFLNNYMRVTRADIPRQRHYYLTMIGVHETARGQGLGKVLMQEIISQVEHDQQAIGIGLDTENRANLRLYEHFGFVLEKEEYLDEMAIYCMFRKQQVIFEGK